ncbi:hypothetical protein QYE76_067560 [Lolium multiflorum]|uniref:Reverse transcriptase Ty1/copia-type domain-containing protein n=1 Tax=Lolium multiflorum TaxID=4521 RepID=A0AAD8SF28_LOLMU|nr:hypothetical protein QYE76_067560 [Lolium multiflorum]
MSFPLHGLFVSVVLQVTLLVSMVSLSSPSRLLIGMPSVILNGSLPWLRRSLRLSALALGILFLPLLVFVLSREHGRDYDETFAPVAHMTIVCTLLVVSSVRRWSVSQLDVQNTFLNGELSEEVYMQPPPGYSVPDGMVCRLRRSLYGLKQAPRAWFERFASVVTAAGFSPSFHDPALFVHTSPRGRTLLLLYVDDMIITGDDPEYIAFVKARLRDQFLMTDLGPLRYFLGIEVSSTSDGFSISQEKYIQDLLARAALGDERTVETPMELNVKLRPTDGDPLPDPTPGPTTAVGKPVERNLFFGKEISGQDVPNDSLDYLGLLTYEHRKLAAVKKEVELRIMPPDVAPVEALRMAIMSGAAGGERVTGPRRVVAGVSTRAGAPCHSAGLHLHLHQPSRVDPSTVGTSNITMGPVACAGLNNSFGASNGPMAIFVANIGARRLDQ